jgi:hypothetical protein
LASFATLNSAHIVIFPPCDRVGFLGLVTVPADIRHSQATTPTITHAAKRRKAQVANSHTRLNRGYRGLTIFQKTTQVTTAHATKKVARKAEFNKPCA